MEKTLTGMITSMGMNKKNKKKIKNMRKFNQTIMEMRR
jgi:hypothetical protein